MRKAIFSLWLLIAATTCFAQTETERSNKQWKPDLSGTWLLDKSKSREVDADHFTLVIVHLEPEIRITEKLEKDGRRWTKELVHYTDGRSDTNIEQGEHYSKTKIRWQGNTLVREQLHTSFGVKFEMVTTEEWKLSKDNKSLTRTIVNRQKISMNETIIPRLVRKYVFTRSP